MAKKKTSEDKKRAIDPNVMGLRAEVMWLTTMSPDTRRLIKVMPEDVEQTARMFDLLLGDDLTGRKNHIADHGHEFLELADIS